MTLRILTGLFQTLRQVVSKTANVFDIRGTFAPIIGGLRLDTRKPAIVVTDWDSEMPDELRKT